METVNAKELTDEFVYPDESILRTVLGRSYRAFIALLEVFVRHGLVHEWRYYRDGKAWFCKVRNGKKTIVWLSARKGYMKATIYILERRMDEVYALRISENTKDRFRETKNAGHSKPCIFEIRNQKILRDMDAVIRFKIRMK